MTIYYQLIDAIPASIYWKDLEGSYLGCNRYMLEMVGVNNRGYVIGKNDLNFPWQEQAQAIQEMDRRVIENKTTIISEEKPVIYDGTTQKFLSSKTPLIDKRGEIVGIIGTSINITDIVDEKAKKNIIDFLSSIKNNMSQVL